MAFLATDYLKQGKVDFVFGLTPYDYNYLVEYVRNDEDKNAIIKGFLPHLLDDYSQFCFSVIYDNDEFKKETKYLLEKGFKISDEKIINVLNNTSWGKDYIFEHRNEIIDELNEETLIKLFELIFSRCSEYQDYINYFKIHKDLHIRYLFMKYLIENETSKLPFIYDNFLDYLTSYTHQEFEQLTFLPELMDVFDISALAYSVLKSNLDRQYFDELKEFILANYESNDLAKLLLESKEIKVDSYYILEHDQEGINEFTRDADRLFATSATYKLYILEKYSSLIKDEILNSFARKMSIFRKEDEGVLDSLFYYNLGKYVLDYIDKYLSLSKDETCEYLNKGTTATVYRIGDFVLKLVSTKWSYEEIICPNLYFIIKNLEETYIRNDRGIVQAGLEVEQYLKKDVSAVPRYIFDCIIEAIEKSGFIWTERYRSGAWFENCRVLNSYLDADCNKHRYLPDWFKEYPVVIVDRDRFYENVKGPDGKVHIKQLQESWD